MTIRRKSEIMAPMVTIVTKKAPPREWTPALRRRLRLALDAKGMNQSTLAAKVGIKPASVSGWLKEEGGTAPSVTNLLDVSNALDISVDWLLGRGPEELPDLVSRPIPLSRQDVALVCAAAIQVSLEKGLMPQPEDLAALVLSGCDYLSEHRASGKTASFEDICSIFRHFSGVQPGPTSIGTARS